MASELRTLGRTGLEVGRLGVAASYGVPASAVERAFEQGVNYLYWGSMRRSGFAEAIRHLASQRGRLVVVLQSYSRMGSLLGWSVERGLRALGLEYADILLLGLWNKPVPERILEASRALRERSLVRFLAVSSHNRRFVPELAANRDLDVIHFRYNAAHPGAEVDIFPRLPVVDRAGTVSYTATSWGQLLKPVKIPRGERVPTASDCYRFVLSRPEVDVCLTGPANRAQMDEALKALQRGPMDDEELAWMRRVGAAVAGRTTAGSH
ncbi:MAG: aldo/keto reductase [Acidobacteriia bacterium]|nr:aldo/keto reductase [Terriglobia bacterium]